VKSMAALNVLVFSAPSLSDAQHQLRAGLLTRLEDEPRVEFAAVTLPRAEAMLVPRLIGLWTVLVFVGGSGDTGVPSNTAVLETQSDLFDELPPVAIVGHPADLWPDWERFQSYLYRSGADRTAVDAEGGDALPVLWERIMTLPAPIAH
jgi:hypothetical protein